MAFNLFSSVHTGHLMYIELDWMRTPWMCIHQILIQSTLIPIHFRGGFDPDWSGLYNCALHLRTKRHGIHKCIDYIDSEHTSPGYTLCFMYLLISRSNMMAGWSTDQTWVPLYSCVELWPLEVWIPIGQFGYWTGLNLDSVERGEDLELYMYYDANTAATA